MATDDVALTAAKETLPPYDPNHVRHSLLTVEGLG